MKVLIRISFEVHCSGFIQRTEREALVQPVAPRWFDEPNWYDYVTELDLQPMPEDDHVTELDLQPLPEADHALVWYPDENHWE